MSAMSNNGNGNDGHRPTPSDAVIKEAQEQRIAAFIELLPAFLPNTTQKDLEGVIALFKDYGRPKWNIMGSKAFLSYLKEVSSPGQKEHMSIFD